MSTPTDPLAFPASAGPSAQDDAPPMSVPTFDVTGVLPDAVTHTAAWECAALRAFGTTAVYMSCERATPMEQ